MKGAEKNIKQMQQFIEDFNFATIISEAAGELTVSHVPVLLDRAQGSYGMLSWHMARQNAHTPLLDGNKKALCIFHGPHAYVSPQWYAHQPKVPTWNYAVVYAYGTPRMVSPVELASDLSKMLEKYEDNGERLMPRETQTKLIDYIQGYRMEITRLEGKFKLGQNRSTEDQAGMLKGLLSSGRESAALAEFIQLFLKNNEKAFN